MNENEEKLINKYKEIKKKGWIKGVNNNTNSVGLTFEKLLNKETDDLFFPDYKGIEIKCSQYNSHYPLSLFSIAFDGPNVFEMNEILNKYGKINKEFIDKKTLWATLFVNEKVLVNNKYYFELELCSEEKKLYLKVCDLNKNLIEKTSYINYESIKNHLEIKLSSLAFIKAFTKKIENDKYFFYNQINIFELKSFDIFLKLLQSKGIYVSLIGRISRSGKYVGKQCNKSIIFQIKKENLVKLFNKKY